MRVERTCPKQCGFSHLLQSRPVLRGHAETLKGIYCNTLAVATNDVDNVWNDESYQHMSLMKKLMNAISGCAFMKINYSNRNAANVLIIYRNKSG